MADSAFSEIAVLAAHKELILGGKEVPWPVRSVRVGRRCGYSFQTELYASSRIASVRCLISVGPLLIFLPDGLISSTSLGRKLRPVSTFAKLLCKRTLGRRVGRSGNRFVAQGHSVRREEVGELNKVFGAFGRGRGGSLGPNEGRARWELEHLVPDGIQRFEVVVQDIELRSARKMKELNAPRLVVPLSCGQKTRTA